MRVTTSTKFAYAATYLAAMLIGVSAMAREHELVPPDWTALTSTTTLDVGAVDYHEQIEYPDGGFSATAGLDFDLSAFAEDAPADAETAVASTDGEPSASDLAKAAQNPIANMISLPFQNNTSFGIGPNDKTANVLNIQPVLPFELGDEWTLITRTIVPLVYVPEITAGLPYQAPGGDSATFGLGDIQFTGFFSPKTEGVTVGFGPVFRFPSATDARLGARKWSLGPSIVVLKTEGPWVVGGLAQNVWSVAGAGENSVNQLLVQPFVNYNLNDGWYVSSSPIITANWLADSDDRWTVPLGGGVGKVFKLGDQSMNASVQAFYNVVAPDLGPDWTLRVQLQLLFPK